MFTKELFEKTPRKTSLDKKKNKVWWVALVVLVLVVALLYKPLSVLLQGDAQPPVAGPVEPVNVQPPVAGPVEPVDVQQQVAGPVEPVDVQQQVAEQVEPVDVQQQVAEQVEPIDVQQQVAELVEPEHKTVTDGISYEEDLFTMAKRTIRGDFGNGEERKMKLKERYSSIQRQVNEFYRIGDLYW